ncbi:MAG TPA: DUF885 domain-containing protein [Opitutaceae bacterium]|nr:DUF885 domain-containing protein [Opitutaceae bacterium]
MPFRRPSLAFALALVAAVNAAGGSFTPEQIAAECARANAFFEKAFDQGLERSPMFMTQLGMKRDYDKWDDFSEQKALEDLRLAVEQLVELKRTVNVDALDEQTRLSYRLFVSQTEEAIEGWKWRHHDYLLNQMRGMHASAPAFLINFHRVDDPADARAYVARLRGLGPLFDQLIAGVKLRESKGVLPPKFVFPLVMDAARQVIAGEPFDASGKKSALWEDFTAKVAAIKDLDAGARDALLADGRAALLDVVKPAYDRLLGVLAAQHRVATDEDGAWKLPDGRAYYEFMLRSYTTTHLSADEIHETGLREVARIHAEMATIKEKVGFRGTLPEFFVFMREDPQFYYPNTPEGKQAYITRATEFIDGMRARLDELFLVKPKAGLVVKPVEPFREEGSAAAFYERPAPDGSRPGAYYVNTFEMRGLPIYEMESLAYHEAIPGHHMQIAIAQELEGIPRFRKFGGNTAYIEGWALYTELVPKEHGFFTDPYMDFGRLSSELLRATRLVVDTGIHARKWTREQTMGWLRANAPFPERDIFTETNRYIVLPGQACSYKVGMMKILELRELARRELGPRFDLREYHDLVLKDGALPLSLLEENVRGWIARKKSA